MIQLVTAAPNRNIYQDRIGTKAVERRKFWLMAIVGRRETWLMANRPITSPRALRSLTAPQVNHLSLPFCSLQTLYPPSLFLFLSTPFEETVLLFHVGPWLLPIATVSDDSRGETARSMDANELRPKFQKPQDQLHPSESPPTVSLSFP